MPELKQYHSKLPEPFVFREEWPHTIGEAIGAASTCWESLEGTGVFQSERAESIAAALEAKFNEILALKDDHAASLSRIVDSQREEFEDLGESHDRIMAKNTKLYAEIGAARHRVEELEAELATFKAPRGWTGRFPIPGPDIQQTAEKLRLSGLTVEVVDGDSLVVNPPAQYLGRYPAPEASTLQRIREILEGDDPVTLRIDPLELPDTDTDPEN